MTRLERKLNVKRLFINATMTIIQEEGIEEVSIRKVAKITGYNSATLYTYFKNLDHLIFLASMKFLKEYIIGLDAYTEKAETPLEESILVWEFFCKCSFKKPEIYKSIFFSNLVSLSASTVSPPPTTAKHVPLARIATDLAISVVPCLKAATSKNPIGPFQISEFACFITFE